MIPGSPYAPPKEKDRRSLPLLLRLALGLVLVVFAGFVAISVRDVLGVVELSAPTRSILGTLSGAISGVWAFQLLLPRGGRGRNFFVLILGIGLPILFLVYGPSAIRTGPPIGIVEPNEIPDRK